MMALPHPRITLKRHPKSRRFTWVLQARNARVVSRSEAGQSYTQRGVALRNAAAVIGVDAYEAASIHDTTGITPDYSRGPIRA